VCAILAATGLVIAGVSDLAMWSAQWARVRDKAAPMGGEAATRAHFRCWRQAPALPGRTADSLFPFFDFLKLDLGSPFGPLEPGRTRPAVRPYARAEGV
jgi:hypothetical protein